MEIWIKQKYVPGLSNVKPLQSTMKSKQNNANQYFLFDVCYKMLFKKIASDYSVQYSLDIH